MSHSTLAAKPALQAAPSWWTRAMPFVFVLLWSSGFVVAKAGLPHAPTFTFLSLRFVGVLAVLVPVALLLRIQWPVKQIGHLAIAGVLLQAGYLGGVWSAIKLGMPAGLSALIVGMQPILTALAAPLIGESVQRRQWTGLILGLCGVALVASNKVSLTGISPITIGSCVLALASITAGTLYQKHYCSQFDLRAGSIIQFAASLGVVLPLAITFEHLSPNFATVSWTPSFIASLLWSIFALSIGAISLLFALIRKSAATRVTSLLYLTPPTTALLAWLMFGEQLSLRGIFGMIVAAIGVAFVVRRRS